MTALHSIPPARRARFAAPPREMRPGGPRRRRQNPRFSRAPAQSRSKNVKCTGAHGQVAACPGQVQPCRTPVRMRTGREHRCRRSVRSLSGPRTDIPRDFAIVPPRMHGCGRVVTGPSVSRSPLSAARLDAVRTGARLFSPRTDADRWRARLLSPRTGADRWRARLFSSGRAVDRGATPVNLAFLHRAVGAARLQSGCRLSSAVRRFRVALPFHRRVDKLPKPPLPDP